jgi:hypothetical protein
MCHAIVDFLLPQLPLRMMMHATQARAIATVAAQACAPGRLGWLASMADTSPQPGGGPRQGHHNGVRCTTLARPVPPWMCTVPHTPF